MAMTAPSYETDALIIGAGPVGLYQSFQLGLLGMRCHIVDALPHVGGQCAELYPDKPIYDIPGIPVCTGLELIERLQQQIRPFAHPIHLGQLVNGLTPSTGAWLCSTDKGLKFQAKVVVIAAGVGAFVPKTLKLDGAESFLGQQFHYHFESIKPNKDMRVVVFGGDELALSWAIQLAELDTAYRPNSISLLYRREVLSASADTLAKFSALRQAGRVTQYTGQPTQLQADANGQLAQLCFTAPEGSAHCVSASTVLAATGLSPKLGPIADWGLAMHTKQLVIDPATSQTSQAGIFAVGDINTYPGKKKLIACGFHECIMAAYAAAELVTPGETGSLQYTTSSALLQRRLGLTPSIRSE